MKCYASPLDVCHNTLRCTQLGKCAYERELDKIQVPEGYEEMEYKKRNGSPEFYKLLEAMGDIHDKKSHDYAMASNPFSNFERAGEIASWFKNPVDIAFAALIGVKLARLAELSNTGKEPNNESVEDTHLDLATYCALWAAYKKEEGKKEPSF